MSDEEEPCVTPKSLFDKKRCQLCICIEVTDSITNEKDLHNTSFWYPLHCVQKESSEIKVGSIVHVDLDGLGGTKKNTIVEAKIIDSRPHSMRACKGLSLVIPEGNKRKNTDLSTQNEVQHADSRMLRSKPQQEVKRPKTKDIRKIMNNAAFNTEASEIILVQGQENFTNENVDENKENKHIESSDDEEKLTFNQKMLARMAYGMEKMDSTFGLFFSQSCENTNATKNLLKTLVSKVESNSNRHFGPISWLSSSLTSLQHSNVATAPVQASSPNSKLKRSTDSDLSPNKRHKSSFNSSSSDETVKAQAVASVVILTKPISVMDASNELVLRTTQSNRIESSATTHLSSSNSSSFLDDPIFDKIYSALNEPVQAQATNNNGPALAQATLVQKQTEFESALNEHAQISNEPLLIEKITVALNEPVQNPQATIVQIQTVDAAALNEPVHIEHEPVVNAQVANALNDPGLEPSDDDDDNGVPRRAKFFPYQAEYDTFRERFDELIDEHIPRRYRTLSFKEMTKLTEFDLKTPLRQIDATLLRHLNNNLNMFKLLKKRYCDARRRQRYINRNESRNGN